MNETTKPTKRQQNKYIIMNTDRHNLVSLKVLLFCFFGGIGCIFPFLPLHMRKVGLTATESQIVSAVAPLVALLGPWLACPLVDRLNGLRANNGRGIRVMLVFIMLLAAVFYALLMCIPTVTRFDSDHKPTLSFFCGPERALLRHERCTDPACHSWDTHEVGELNLINCQYDCEAEYAEIGKFGMLETQTTSTTTEETLDLDADVEGSGDANELSLEVSPEDEEDDQYIEESDDLRQRRQVNYSVYEPPHLCYTDSDGATNCKVYTRYSKRISINVSLYSDELKPKGQFCHYDIIPGSGKNFSCRIPANLPGRVDNKTCIVHCDVEQEGDSNLLTASPCQRIRGNPAVSFWTYLVVRSVADIFPTAALALLAAIIVVATHETSIGHGDVGRQLAWGWIGLAISGLIMGFLSIYDFGQPDYWVQFVACAVLMICASAVVIFAKSLPLGQPDWWWHAKGSVTLGVPRYSWELAALTLVLILLGIFWSALDSYLPWHLNELLGSELLLCLTLTAGALPAIPVMWFSQHVVDYCGHSNLLIIAFIFYIVRYTALYALWSPWWLLLCCEALEFLTLSLAWLAAILYLRHLVPRHLTATGQGLAVAAHFCIGRSIGAIIAGALSSDESRAGSLMYLYQVGAVAAAVVATLYFIGYHCCFKPHCLGPRSTRGSQSNSGVPSGPTTNGTYTPLRVYHNAGTDDQKVQHKY